MEEAEEAEEGEEVGTEEVGMEVGTIILSNYV